MTVWIDNRTAFEWNAFWEEIVKKAVRTSLLYENFEQKCEISVSIVTEEEIQKINKTFRNVDSPTDVLSFPQLTFEEGEIAQVNEKDEIILGDIIISIERAKKQSEEYGHSLEREIAFLTVHSMLHLLGYDHMQKEEEKEMFFKQEQILQQAGFFRKEGEEL
ncbi:MAG TPA: rRNA maturation RNase YbeY [Candidatus Coprocola pullicola]|nr:rRNA maturation RNase YbeY [Candidatus Coprocola pullicola]